MGGEAISVRVQHEPLDTCAEEAALRCAAPGIGAIVSFSGMVRDADDGTLVDSLYLEHYPGMTERSILEIAERARQRWPLLGVRIAHRVGTVPVGAVVVQVAVAARHRAEAFDAAAFIMDYLKTKVPLWKKEQRADGACWVAARSSDAHRAAHWEKGEKGEIAMVSEGGGSV